MVIHWDGKMLQDLIGRTMVERIAVLASYNGTSKFLGAPKVLSSSGANISDVVYQKVVEWGIADQVKGISYDTTASNTGKNIGAAVLLQKKIGQKLINLPCRHHIYEIVLRSVFEKKLSPSSAPNVGIFERFAKSWPDLNHDSINTSIVDEIVCSQINGTESDDIIQFCYNQLTKSQIRNDYQELLQLAVTFLGAGRFKFRTPGVTSNARWMSKAIYSLKIYLFRDQFSLTDKEIDGFRDICIFLIKLYIKPWFGCTNGIAAPLQDLNFIKATVQYA